MGPRAWIALTVGLTLAVGGGVVLANRRADLYGLYGHASNVPIFDSERRGKYLLSQRYVPEHFAAVLLGSSLTANWNTSTMKFAPTYNESTDGGNITEEKVLAEELLRRPGIKTAICIVHPFITDTHGVNTQEMTPRENLGALGSTSLLRSYAKRWSLGRHHGDVPWDAYGTEASQPPTHELNPTLRRIMAPGVAVHIDDQAFTEYGELLRELRAHGIKLVAVVPPTLSSVLEPKREAFDAYVARMHTLFAPDELFLDFNTPAYAAFRDERSNFGDGVHLSTKGAASVVQMLDAELRASYVPPR